MLIYVTTEAAIAGTVWPKGTRLEAPDAAAKAAIAAGIASLDAPGKVPSVESEIAPEIVEEPKRRGRPPKA